MKPKQNITRRVISTQRRDSPPSNLPPAQSQPHTSMNGLSFQNANSKREASDGKEKATMLYFCLPSSLDPKVKSPFQTFHFCSLRFSFLMCVGSCDANSSSGYNESGSWNSRSNFFFSHLHSKIIMYIFDF